MKLFLIVFFAATFGIFGCQQKPTVVTTENTSILAAEPSIKKLVTADTVVVDARSSFDFGLNHIPGSINLQWSDFSVPGSSNQGFLDHDKFKLARRLAILGIDPETPVLVIGPGKKGEGQEGRLAWMFKLLGIQKVNTMNYELLKAQVANSNEIRPSGKPMWKPILKESYEMDYADFYTLIRAHQVEHHLPPVPLRQGKRVGRNIQGSHLYVIDVRDAAEKSKSKDPQDFISAQSVIAMPWTDFWSDQGQANADCIHQLTQHGITPNDEIVVMSATGVKASGVVYALRELGFDRSHVLEGGLAALQEIRKPTNPGVYQ